MKFRTLYELDSSEGTVQLVDSTDHHASHVEHLGNKDIILVPQPSSDPNDPLLWPQWKKIVVFCNICTFAFLGNANIGGLSPGFRQIAEEFDLTPARASQLITTTIVVLGCSNFFWTPMAIWLGKRPIFILATFIFFVSNIWAMESPTFGSLLGSVNVAAFACGSTEALGAAIVNDLFFLHERGSKMGIYLIFLSLGSSIGPLCGGFIIENCGWVWFKRILAIFSGVNFVSVVLFAPETRFFRPVIVPTPSNTVDESSDKTADASGVEKGNNANAAVHEEAARHNIPPKKTYFQTLSPWSGINPEGNLLRTFLRPLPLIFYPANLFATIAYATCLAWVVILASNISFLLSSPPWTFSPSIIGLVNLPSLIGNLLGALVTGWPCDKYTQWKARRAGGVFQPETRLVFLWLPALVVPAGCLMYGFGAQYQMSWPIIFIGAGCVGVGLTAVANVSMTYAVDSYYPISAESLLVINGIKNILAFGMSTDGTLWIEKQGYKNSFGTMSGLTVAVLLFAVPLAFFGQKIRHYSSTHMRLILD